MDSKIKKRIYIAGQITGLTKYDVVLKFHLAEKLLQAQGYEVANPVALVNDFNKPWHEAMRIALAAMLTCDAVYLLPCWCKSKGAILENEIAYNLKMEIIHAPEN